MLLSLVYFKSRFVSILQKCVRILSSHATQKNQRIGSILGSCFASEQKDMHFYCKTHDVVVLDQNTILFFYEENIFVEKSEFSTILNHEVPRKYNSFPSRKYTLFWLFFSWWKSRLRSGGPPLIRILVPRKKSAYYTGKNISFLPFNTPLIIIFGTFWDPNP